MPFSFDDSYRRGLQDFESMRQRIFGSSPSYMPSPDQRRATFERFYNLGLQIRKQKEQEKKEKENLKKIEQFQREMAQAGVDEQTIKEITDSILKGSDKVTDEQVKQIEQKKKQVVDARTKLAAIGKDPNAPLDNRNAIEKALNLPGGGFLNDALDLLDRVGNASRNAIDTYLTEEKKKGNTLKDQVWKSLFPTVGLVVDTVKNPNQELNEIKNVAQSAWDGLLGRKRITGAELLGKHAGMKDDWKRDVAGFAVDVLTDPTSYIGVGAAKSVGKELVEQGAKQAAKPGLLEKFGHTVMDKTGLDYVFGSAGKKKGLNGEYIGDKLIDLENEALAQRNFYHEKALNDVADAMKTAGGYQTGELVGKGMERANLGVRKMEMDRQIRQLEDQLYNLQNASQPKSSLVAKYKFSPKPSPVTGNLQDQIDEITAKIDELRSSPKYQNLTRRLETTRQIMQDPRLRQSVEKLMSSNQDLMQLAKETGVELDEIAGYMAHVMSEEAEKLIPAHSKLGVFRRLGQGADKVAERKMPGTVDEINDTMRKELGVDLFEKNAYLATVKGQQRLANFIVLQGLLKKVLTDPQLAKAAETVSAAPKNAKLVNIADIFKLGDKTTQEALKQLGAGKSKLAGHYYITPGVEQSIKNFIRVATNDAELNKFVKGYDSVLRVFRKLALFTGTYHLNNLAGSIANQFIRGMNAADLVKYNTEAANTVRLAQTAIQKGGLKSNKLSDAERKALQEYEEFLKQGLGNVGFYGEDFVRRTEKDIMKELAYRAKSKTGKVLENLKPQNWLEGSRKVGEKMDIITRFATYRWAKASGATAKQAGKIVKEVHYDYSQLTPAEREVFKRILPFYTYTRKTIPFMIKYALLNPGKINNLNRVSQLGYNLTDQRKELMPDYITNNLGIPISADKVLNLGLPTGVIGQAFDSPAGMFRNMLTPAFKVPIDIAVNQDFKGAPISKDGNPIDYAKYGLEQFIPILSRLEKAGQTLWNQGDVGKAAVQALSLDPTKTYDEGKLLAHKWKDIAASYQKALDQAKAEGKTVPKIEDLRKAGLVSKGQVSEKQIKEAQALYRDAIKSGVDEETARILLKIKQNVERNGVDTALQWRQFLESRGVPESIIERVVGKPLIYSLPDQLAIPSK